MKRRFLLTKLLFGAAAVPAIVKAKTGDDWHSDCGTQHGQFDPCLLDAVTNSWQHRGFVSPPEDEIILNEEVIKTDQGDYYLFTSPDVKGLFVGSHNRQKAWADIPEAARILTRLNSSTISTP